VPAADYQRQQGQPITRGAPRARLSISNQAASGLLRQLRSEGKRPTGASLEPHMLPARPGPPLVQGGEPPARYPRQAVTQ
jgi:hypothetical protein